MTKTRKITKTIIECASCGAEIETDKINGYVQCGNRLDDDTKCGKRTKL